MDTPYVREYHEDREITAWFLLDLSPSVDFGTVDEDREKRTVLIDFVDDPGPAADPPRQPGRGDARTGGGAETDDPGRDGPGPGPAADRGPPPPAAPPGRAVHRPRRRSSRPAHRRIKRRSLVVLVSDFIGVPGWERPLELLNRRHELLAVRLVDPREIDLPDVGPVLMEDAETGEQLYVDTRDAAFRRRFRAAADAREAAIAASFRRAGVEAVTLSTDDDLVRAIVRMAMERRLRRRKRA